MTNEILDLQKELDNLKDDLAHCEGRFYANRNESLDVLQDLTVDMVNHVENIRKLEGTIRSIRS